MAGRIFEGAMLINLELSTTIMRMHFAWWPWPDSALIQATS